MKCLSVYVLRRTESSGALHSNVTCEHMLSQENKVLKRIPDSQYWKQESLDGDNFPKITKTFELKKMKPTQADKRMYLVTIKK